MISTTQLGVCLALVPLGAMMVACSDSDDDGDFTSSPLTIAFVGEEYAYTVTTKGKGDVPRILTSPALPRWLTFTDHGDGSALLRGVPGPKDAGLHPVELRLEVAGRSSSQGFDIDVQSGFTEVGVDDEFEDDELQKHWRFFDPRGTSELTIADGTIQISIPGGVPHDLWRGNENQAPRLLQSVENKNFGVEARFLSVPEKRFQIQGIVAQEADDKFVRLDMHHDGVSVRVYAAYIDGNIARVRMNESIKGEIPDRLRVLRTGDFWTLQYSAGEDDWKVASAFSQPLEVNEIGVFAGNAHGVDSPAFTAIIDYFRNADVSDLPDVDFTLPDPDDEKGDPGDGGKQRPDDDSKDDADPDDADPDDTDPDDTDPDDTDEDEPPAPDAPTNEETGDDDSDDEELPEDD